jgi:hypothetical protein
MKALLFSEFYEGNYEDHGYELYLIRDPDGNVMYIGISRDSIWHRWFGGGTSHMDRDTIGRIYGKSYIGEVIERRFPISWKWLIELWTKEDCLEVCAAELTGKDLEKIEIESIEPYMIVRLEPLYNVIHGGGRHEDPLTTKTLDTIYKDLFG